MDWLKARVKEVSSWSGAGLIVLGGLIILGGTFVNLLAWDLSHGASSQSGRKTNIMFGQLKLILIAITLLGGSINALVYVYKLKADNDLY